jgi:hypothetical protein
MRNRKKKLSQDTVLTANREWAFIKKSKKESVTGTDDYWHVTVSELGKPNGEHYSLYVVDDFKNQKHWQPILDAIEFDTVVCATGDLSMVRKKRRKQRTDVDEVVIDADCRLNMVGTMNKKYYLSEDWKNLETQDEK